MSTLNNPEVETKKQKIEHTLSTIEKDDHLSIFSEYGEPIYIPDHISIKLKKHLEQYLRDELKHIEQ